MKKIISNWKVVLMVVLAIYSLIITIIICNLRNAHNNEFVLDDKEIDNMIFSGDTTYNISTYHFVHQCGDISISSNLGYNIILADQTCFPAAPGEVYSIIRTIYLESGKHPGPIVSGLVLDCLEKQAGLGDWIGYSKLSEYYEEGVFAEPDSIKRMYYLAKCDSLLKIDQ